MMRPWKAPCAAPAGHPLDQLAGLPAGRGMVDRGDDVRLVAAGDDKGAVDPAARASPSLRTRRLVPHRAAAEQQHEAGEAAPRPERRLELRRDAPLRAASSTSDRAGQLGAVGQPQLRRHRCANSCPFAGIAFEDAGAAAGAERDQAAGVKRAPVAARSRDGRSRSAGRA